MQQQASARATAEQVAAEISKSYPFLEPIKRYLPKNAAELASYVNALAKTVAAVAAALALHQCPSSEKRPDTQINNFNIQQEPQQSLEQAPDRQKAADATKRHDVAAKAPPEPTAHQHHHKPKE